MCVRWVNDTNRGNNFDLGGVQNAKQFVEHKAMDAERMQFVVETKLDDKHIYICKYVQVSVQWVRRLMGQQQCYCDVPLGPPQHTPEFFLGRVRKKHLCIVCCVVVCFFFWFGLHVCCSWITVGGDLV